MYNLLQIIKVTLTIFLFCTSITRDAIGSNKITQYNQMIENKSLVAGVEKTSMLDFNNALICVEKNCFLVSSGVIDNNLHEYIRGNETTLGFPPQSIFVMDLLYITDPLTYGVSLEEKIQSCRQNPNRREIANIIKETWEVFKENRDNIFKDYSCNKASLELEVVLKKDNRKLIRTTSKCPALCNFINLVSEDILSNNNCNIENTNKSIKDFLEKLKQYTEDIAVRSSGETNVANITNIDYKNLIQEINTQIEETNQNSTEVEKNNLAKSMVNLLRLIRGTKIIIGDIWRITEKTTLYKQSHNPNYCLSNITHTEQMIDWLSFKFGYDIQVIISGKAPCLKCSRYIRDVNNKTSSNTWNNRTVIGFNTGWKNIKQLKEYKYPVKVFNANPVNTDGENWTYQTGEPGTWLRQFDNPEDSTYSPSNPDRELMWRNKNGYYGSNVYAIENYGSYSEQLMMNSDGSVSEKEPKGVIPRNSLGGVNRTTYPILLPAEQNPTTGLDDQIDINIQPNPATDPIKRKREILLTPAQVTKRLRQEKRAKEKEETNKQSQYTSLKKNPSEERNKSNNPDDQQIPPPSLLNNF